MADEWPEVSKVSYIYSHSPFGTRKILIPQIGSQNS
uniref:Uncharacterized protein n=1 Tax=Lepeophtheirus salmonis TaxID=72036 RepID=A0A0K2VF96_LEPSM